MTTGIEQRKVEIATAIFFVMVGGVVIVDSFRTGFSWTSDGPAPGYFPFYIGLFMVVAAVYQIGKTIKHWSAQADDEFASKEQMGLVLRMFIPIVIYVVGVMSLGIYVSSVVYITAFMIWQGKFSVLKSLLVALGVTAALFLLFEIWFHVALPKGPLEAFFGF
jgi:putative tricarboxylic transport membrane protein